MLLVETYLAPSKIHGMGLFAADLIRPGVTWWRFHPTWDKVFSVEEVAQLPTVAQKHLTTYGFFDGRKWTLCGDHASFVNHSATPNSSHMSELSISSANINAGDEITENYNDFDLRPAPF
jgi:hypothetical protein